jgi:MYXO-CTERM domain-containing protein
MNSFRIHHIAAIAAGLVMSGAAMAQSTWNLVPSGGCTQNGSTFGNNFACTGTGTAGTALTAYAFSTRNGTASSTATDNFQAVSASQYANAYLSPQGTSGLGVANRAEGLSVSAPDHAIDNNPTGSFDMVVLNFGSAVVLDQVGIGWSQNSNGSDMTIMRWTGTGSPMSTTATPEVGSNSALTIGGWTLVSSLADVLADGSAPYGGNARSTGATSTQGSSWWMIAAFNTTLNTGNICRTNNSGGTIAENTNVGTTTTPDHRCDDGDDFFKLNYLRTTVATTPPGSVSAPGTLALAGLGLLGAAFLRRRQA